MKLKDGYQQAHTLLKDKVIISLLCTLKGSPIDHPSKPKTVLHYVNSQFFSLDVRTPLVRTLRMIVNSLPYSLKLKWHDVTDSITKIQERDHNQGVKGLCLGQSESSPSNYIQ